MLHIDFSENYLLLKLIIIQSVHFGGSHQQATLHTGVLYTAEDQSPLAFCSISPSRRHDPTAIWAHLDPVLGMIRQTYLEVKKLNWNYFEAGHGKGAPDGVGGELKRSEDRAIKHRGDIFNAPIPLENGVLSVMMTKPILALSLKWRSTTLWLSACTGMG